ncbi:molybdate transporter 1 [Forsythia ovata]|uniref:Molybdate transporter 1 n=1 Tax=Forsythia ovata TaxID=205694 RepID=A0ABD1XC82_9LAMI
MKNALYTLFSEYIKNGTLNSIASHDMSHMTQSSPHGPMTIGGNGTSSLPSIYEIEAGEEEDDVLATSVFGIMNLIGCWFGTTPCCHGARRLAGKYKFGGRNGVCVALFGVAKLVLGLVLGSSLVKILDQFPVGVLGVLLLFAGIELAMCSRDMNSKEESVVMLICTLFHLLAQVQHLLCDCSAFAS